MRRRLAMVAAGAGLVLLSVPLPAHHAFSAEFDSNNPVTLKGAVTKIEWINPHSWLYIDVKDRRAERRCPGRSRWARPISCSVAGGTRTSLPVGTEVIVEGYRAKNGSDIANGGSVVLADGRKLFVGSSGTGAPYDEKK